MIASRRIRTLTVAAVAALSLGCAAAPTARVAPTAPGGEKLTMLSGDEAVEDGQMRVKVVDQTGGRGGYALKALPGTWDSANLRLISNSTFVNNTVAGRSRLTGDRTVTLASSAFTSYASGTAYATSNAAATALFTKLRPGQYMFQISLVNTATTPDTTVAVQTVTVPITGGAITNLVVTLQTTAEGTASVAITSTGEEDLGAGNVTLKNSTAHASANFAFVQGDTVSIASPLDAADVKANTQDATANGGGTTTTGTAALTGQLSRIVASLRAGSTATVTTDVPQNTEKIVAVWYDTGNEGRTGQPWSTFYGNATYDTAGIVANVSTTGATVTSGLTAASSFTVPDTDGATAGPNGTGVPSLTLKTTEAGDATDVNAVLIFRYYDNTFEHRFVASETRTVVIDDDASIRVTVN